MLDSEPFELKYIQKSSPSMSDDFVFVEIFKFLTKKNVKYIIRAEMHQNNVFAIKYYASIHKKLEDKYNRLTNNHETGKTLLTCTAVLPILLEKYPYSSFAFNGARSIDFEKDKIEGYANNQRFRIYCYAVEQLIGDETFDHYIFEGISSYLLVNKKGGEDTEKMKDDISTMFLQTYQFSTNL